MGCPLCGELTHKASTRLIRDSCGHIKCRLCLLAEENGCRICEEKHKIDSIGSFNYPLPPSKSPNYEFPNCEPLELTINKIPINLEINDLPQSSEKEITVDESNLQSQNSDVSTTIHKIIQQIEVNNTVGQQNIEKQNASTSQITGLVEIDNSTDSNDFYHSNDDSALVIDEEREESIEDAHNNNLNKEENNQNKNQRIDQIITPVSSRVIENSSETINSRVETSGSIHRILVLQKGHASIKNSSKLEESEKLNSDLPNNQITPKHLNQEPSLVDSGGSPYRSPAVRFSDNLTVNKLNEMAEASPLSFNFRSPFRLSDYIVFKESSSQDEVTQRIEKDLNEGRKKSDDYITADGFLVQRVAAGCQSPTLEEEDNLQNSHFNKTNTATDDTSPTLKVPSYPILKKRFIASSTISNYPKHNQNEMGDPKGTNSSPLEQMKSQNGKKEDEDKENNKNKDKEKTTKKSTKVKSDTKTAALKKRNVPLKSKSKTVNSLKTKSNKSKKKEENDNLDNKPLALRKGERKRKRKVLVYENEVLEVITKKRSNRSSSPKSEASSEPTASPGRRGRKAKKDWSHVIRLPGVPARYRCNVCNAIFGNWRGRNAHANCRQGEAPFKCEICDRAFYKRTHFQYHQRTHTGEKPYSCQLCGKSFVQKNKLNRHLTVHKQQRDIECDICGKKYQSKDYLKNHLLTHQANIYKCSQCPKIFTLAANRKRHELSHSNEKPYNCDICSSKFKRKFLMTRHRRLHDKSRPFSCDDCGRGFISKCAVRRHILTHISRSLNVKPFECEFCKAKFRRKDNLKRHVKYHHTPDGSSDDVAFADSPEIDNQPLKISEPPALEAPAKEKKQKTVDVAQASKTVKEASVQDKAKNATKPKRISRTNSVTSSKSSSASLKSNESNTAVLISIRPTNSKFVFVDDIPREEARLLNQQIELKLHEQKTICNLPGLTRKDARRERSKSNSTSDESTVAKQNLESMSNDCFGNNEPWQKNPHYVHWRRRTAESLRSGLRRKT